MIKFLTGGFRAIHADHFVKIQTQGTQAGEDAGVNRPLPTSWSGWSGVSTPLAYRVARSLQRRFWEFRLNPVLSSASAPSCLRGEAEFDHLQAYPKPPDEYGYSDFQTWQRGNERALALTRMFSLHDHNARVLEIGCGDGMTANALACCGHSVTIVDMDDWRSKRIDGRLQFVKGRVEHGLNLETGQFDLVFSYNTFEHLHDPKAALKEMMRLCSPGGWLYLDFGPLYPSAWGLHAHGSLKMPYPQYLFGEAFVQYKLSSLGIFDLGVARTELQNLNRWRLQDYRRAISELGLQVIAWRPVEMFRHLGLIARYPEAFSGRDLRFEDVAVSLLRVVLRNPASCGQFSS